MSSEFDGLAAFVRRTCGADLSVYDERFLADIVRKRAGEGEGPATWRLLRRFERYPEELDSFVDSLRVGYSEFFRDPLSFACLERVALPAVAEAKRRRGEREIRIWSAACAEGQEAYSVAILCEEFLPKNGTGMTYRLFASDIDEGRIETGRRGIYPRSALGEVALRRLEAFFEPEGEGFRVVARIRDRVDFSRFDLLSPAASCPPASIYGSFDIVLCCNILFYYAGDSRERILKEVLSCVERDGCLVVGEAEREIVEGRGMREFVASSAVFRIAD